MNPASHLFPSPLISSPLSMSLCLSMPTSTSQPFSLRASVPRPTALCVCVCVCVCVCARARACCGRQVASKKALPDGFDKLMSSFVEPFLTPGIVGVFLLSVSPSLPPSPPRSLQTRMCTHSHARRQAHSHLLYTHTHTHTYTRTQGLLGLLQFYKFEGGKSASDQLNEVSRLCA
jgi:hypothetical protein